MLSCSGISTYVHTALGLKATYIPEATGPYMHTYLYCQLGAQGTGSRVSRVSGSLHGESPVNSGHR
jgi:hypothetical protein